jgi:hypothetical protein
MTMENKAIVYAVLAISLGYLLVSAVPSQLAPPMFGEPAGDSEMLRAPGPEHVEAPTESASAPATESDKTFSGDAATAQGDATAAEGTSDEALAAGGGSGPLVVSVFGTWSVNLFIALGVYFIARRRFS